MIFYTRQNISCRFTLNVLLSTFEFRYTVYASSVSAKNLNTTPVQVDVLSEIFLHAVLCRHSSLGYKQSLQNTHIVQNLGHLM
jgi:hypothetical protein